MRSALSLVPLLLAACGGSGQAGDQSAGGQTAAVHQRAPAFEALDQDGVARQLEEFEGKAVVLYFYPRDATPGCTEEACAFRDTWARFEEAGAVVIGVSTDDVAAHRDFALEHELPFPLLADTDEAIAEAYGVPVRMGYAKRMTFLIDGTGVIRRIFENVDPGVHADEVLAAIAEL